MIIDKNNPAQFKIFFFYSPANELVSSLSVMADMPRHIQTRDWARKKYEALPVPLREEIDFFSRNYADWLFITDILLTIGERAYPQELTVEETIEQMMGMDDEEFAYIFLGLSAFEYDIDELRKWMADPDCVTEEALGVQANFLTPDNVRAFLRDIDGMKERLKKVLLDYWHECFSAEWPPIEKYFRSVVRKEELALKNGSYISYLKNLHPDLSVDDEMIVFHKSPDYCVPLKKIRRLVIILSVFTSPDLRGNCVGDTMDIAKNLNFHSVKLQEPIPARITDILYAANDSTRLKIMKILWNSDATTKEIAEVLELAPSTISLHLKILKEAGLVETNKVKKFVYYKLKKENMLKLQENMTEYFSY